MKKKISALLFAAIMAVAAAGCSATDIKISFDTNKPWGLLESSRYDITRSYVAGKEPVVVAEGTYTSTIDAQGANATVKNHFELNYNDVTSVPDQVNTSWQFVKNQNLTDTYDGEVTFSKDSLSPVSASKTSYVAQRPLNDDALPEPQFASAEKTDLFFDEYKYILDKKVKYGDPRSYKYTADYLSNKALFTTTTVKTDKNKNTGKYERTYTPVNKDIKVADNTRYDNEQLNCVVRALQNIKSGGSASVYVSSIVDSYDRGEYVRFTLSVSCSSGERKKVKISSSEFIVKDGDETIEPDSDGYYTLTCLETTLSITSDKSGPAIKMWITDPGYRIISAERESAQTSKLIVEIILTEYTSTTKTYETVYTLNGYSNE